MFFLVVNALNCGYLLGLNPVVWYSFLEGELDICFFVTLWIATVLRVQHGVLALFVLPTAVFFFVLVHSGVMVSHAIGRVRRMPWASRARVALPPNPLHPGHDPAVGWAIFQVLSSCCNDIFAWFIFGLDFATGWFFGAVVAVEQIVYVTAAPGRWRHR
jgi:hypothetical protein